MRGRPGYVLIAVLIVIVVLSLVAYRFTDAMTSEYRAGVRTSDMAQARAAAASGIHYAIGMLADPDTRINVLGDPFNNPGQFQDVSVHTEATNENKQSRFSIISIVPVGSGVYEQRYGVVDESAKLNPNALIKQDPSGQVLFNALMKLPNMTEETADAIVDWVDTNDEPRTNGAESSTYQSLAQSYRAKNGPLNTLDEMLFIRGVTPQLLYGTDRNRNGIGDDSGGSVDRGWADFLTVHSREVNVDASGVLRVWINHSSDDLQAIYDALVARGLDEPMAAYLIAAKIYTRTQLDANGNPLPTGGGGKGKGGKQQKVRIGDAGDLITAVKASLEDASALAPKAINSVFDLVNTRVTLPRTGGTGGAFGTPETVVVNCPLNDPARLNELLPMLVDKVCTKEAVEMFPRVNVNTAPREVLLGLPGLTEAEVDAILGARDGQIPDDPATTSGAWIVTSGSIPIAKYRGLEQYVTGGTMVYRIESVGYLAGGSPVVRIEAVVDLNMGSPRILYYRELTDLDSPRAFQPPK